MKDKQAIIDQLRERISAIEWPQDAAATSYAVGIGEIDKALKHGGVTAGSCHEIICSQSGPALGFLLYLLSSMTKIKGPVLWCSDNQEFYTPGFEKYGLKDADVIFVETNNQQQALWAMEQGLVCDDFSAVVLNAKRVSLAQGRRLKLLAQKHGSTAVLMIKPESLIDLPTIAKTRWLITAEASSGRPSRNGIKLVGQPRLKINLLKNFGGPPLSWTVEFDDRTLRFHTLSRILPSANQDRPESINSGARERSA
ncbi:MAG TPA: hypothetical protein VEL47_08260 [Myxococcota bacterium]|nr:hypothetical protein [Myxococcota bacterium]